MRSNQIPILLRGGGPGFSVDFTLGANGDPLSGYPGPWLSTTSVALGDNLGTYTRGMQTTFVGFATPYRNSTLFNGTFSARIHTDPGGSDYSNVVARLRPDGTAGIVLVAHSASVTWKIQIYDTTNTLQTDYDTTVAFTPGATHDRQLILSGTSVIAKINGVQVGVTQTDSWSVPTQTYMGFGINDPGGVTVTTVENMAARP